MVDKTEPETTGSWGSQELDKFFRDFATSFKDTWLEKDLVTKIEDVAELFAEELLWHRDSLTALVNSASSEEKDSGLVGEWELGIITLNQRLASMPRTGNPEGIAGWLAGNENMPRELRVTSAAGVHDSKEKELLQNAIDKTDTKIEETESLESRLRESRREHDPEVHAAVLGGLDEDTLEPGERDKWTPESGNRRRTITPDDQTIQDRIDESSPSGRWSPETALAEAEAGIVPDGRPAWEQRQDFLAATTVAEGWTAPGRELPAKKDGDGDDNENTNPYDLTDEAYKYITENFGSVDFFLRQKDLMEIDTNGDGIKDTNIIKFIEDQQEENPDVIWGLFQQTEWFELNGPTARQFQVDWDKAQPGGADPNWSPQWDRTGEGGWTNMTPDMLEMLDDTYDSLVLEASRLLGASAVNTPAKKEAIMQMAYNARQLNMTDYELKNEFIENSRLAFDPIAIRSSGTFGAIRNKLKSNAATYMITMDDQSLDELSQQIYLNKATYEGLSSIWAQQAREDNPAVASLIDQGYTPSAYFSSYANVASNLLGRQIDFLGGDNKMYGALTDTMIGENGLERPMTRGEFKRYVRQTPEWDTTENARDEAYSTVGTLLDSFGINN